MPASHAALVAAIRATGVPQRIMDAVEAVDRRDFVPSELRSEAYGDRPVPLPAGQTTSQPTLIAQMVAAAEPTEEGRTLEIGTGYGYQTALLSRLSRAVVSIERWPALASAAQENLRRNGVDNVSVYVGDGWRGWPQRAPYAAIVVSAAASEVPAALIEQLEEGGRLVVPVQTGDSDDVTLLVKRDGSIGERRVLTPARFVPLVRDQNKEEGS